MSPLSQIDAGMINQRTKRITKRAERRIKQSANNHPGSRAGGEDSPDCGTLQPRAVRVPAMRRYRSDQSHTAARRRTGAYDAVRVQEPIGRQPARAPLSCNGSVLTLRDKHRTNESPIVRTLADPHPVPVRESGGRSRARGETPSSAPETLIPWRSARSGNTAARQEQQTPTASE